MAVCLRHACVTLTRYSKNSAAEAERTVLFAATEHTYTVYMCVNAYCVAFSVFQAE
jgi:hypothetical protein